ncbi:MAG: response regulator [Verrucomicrobia bacterium]|nr:response regulator [Verrucomicrobiota bacterium]
MIIQIPKTQRSSWLRLFERSHVLRDFPVEPRHRSLDGIRILIVEDHSDIRLLAARFLAERGAQVFTARDAFEGLMSLRAVHPDLVVTDIRMPSRTGLDLLMDIRNLSTDDGGGVPVIAITAYVLDPEIIDADFQGILRKPFTPDQLLNAVERAI